MFYTQQVSSVLTLQVYSTSTSLKYKAEFTASHPCLTVPPYLYCITCGGMSISTSTAKVLLSPACSTVQVTT